MKCKCKKFNVPIGQKFIAVKNGTGLDIHGVIGCIWKKVRKNKKTK